MSFNETIKSRFDDIIKDGPNIYSGINEMIDNMVDWGKADTISIEYIENCIDKSRPLIVLKDNGPNGFNSEESVKRLFQLGETNTDASEQTIGKFGKGGYKAIISISDIFELTTFIDGHEYNYGTNFRMMEQTNTWDPTGEWKVKKNTTGRGSIFKLYPNFQSKILDTFNFDDLKRNVKRGYHNMNKRITFHFKNASKEEIIEDIRQYSPYQDFSKRKVYSVYLNHEESVDKFIHQEGVREDEEPLAIIHSYILKDLIRKNDLLGPSGNKKPGIDFYRNNRMCNTRYPIYNIRDVGSNLSGGQMRGQRCHITFYFKDKKITEHKSFDDYVGVTTVKDIYEEDDRMDGSLIEILEKISDECSSMYENYVGEKKNSIFNYLSEIENFSINITKETLLSTTTLESYKEEMEKFLEFKMFYYDESQEKINFARSKTELTELKQKGETSVRSNSNSYKEAMNLFHILSERLSEKKNIIRCEEHIDNIMKEKNIDRDTAILEIKKTMEEDKKKELEEKKLREAEAQKKKDLAAKKKKELEEKKQKELEEKAKNKKEKEEQAKKEKEVKAKRDREEKEKKDQEEIEKRQKLIESSTYKTIYTELDKMMTEHPDIFNLAFENLNQ
jgi:hypothetical protein